MSETREYFRKHPVVGIAFIMSFLVEFAGAINGDVLITLTGIVMLLATVNVIVIDRINDLKARVKKLEGVDEVS